MLAFFKLRVWKMFFMRKLYDCYNATDYKGNPIFNFRGELRNHEMMDVIGVRLITITVNQSNSTYHFIDHNNNDLMSIRVTPGPQFVITMPGIFLDIYVIMF